MELENPNNASFIEPASRKQKAKERNQREVNMSKHYPPQHESNKFNCLHCNVYAQQTWSFMYIEGEEYISPGDLEYTNPYDQVTIGGEPMKVSLCASCEQPTFWAAKNIIYPSPRTAPPANSDLPDDVKAVYEEASAISVHSPRATSALLRLALQMLLEHVGRTGKLNTNIKKLVEEGLDSQIQQALDILRVTGNYAVHPGEIVFDDTTDVQALFDLVNIIAEDFVTRPERIQKLYDNLPKKDQKAIKKRDSKTQ